MELSDNVKKNLLDLQYNKYLQFYTTSIIVLFTYIVGIFIAYITNQVDYTKLNQNLLVGIISISVISILVIIMINCKDHLQKIKEEIKKLNL